MPIKVDEEKCIGCGICVRVCMSGVLTLVSSEISSSGLKRVVCRVESSEKCTACKKCIQECPAKALSF